jgi:hypothetical protein
MKSILTAATLFFCMHCMAQTPDPEKEPQQATLADTILQADATYDIILGSTIPIPVEKWYAGPQAITTLQFRFNYPNVSLNAGAGVTNTVDGNSKLHLAGGVSAWTGNHLFETGMVRYGLGNASQPWLDGNTENGWMYRLLYGYKTGTLYPFVEGGFVFANTRDEEFTQPSGPSSTLIRSTVSHAQSWWVAAGGVLDHEFPNHVLVNLKLGAGIENSQEWTDLKTLNEPDETFKNSRNPGFMIMCGLGVGYRLR